MHPAGRPAFSSHLRGNNHVYCRGVKILMTSANASGIMPVDRQDSESGNDSHSTWYINSGAGQRYSISNTPRSSSSSRFRENCFKSAELAK